ncbi:hypothetical protein [Methylobacterium radiodurans]|nr:hypothetical protein [Methylobacterium radiodurans]
MLSEVVRTLGAELVRADPVGGLRRLQRLHDEIAAAARQVEADHPDLMRAGVVEGATHRVCTVLQSAGAWPRTFG